MTLLEEVIPIMNDTVRIERPLHCRRHEDFGGRITTDSLGNSIKVRTRTHDHQDDVAASSLHPAVTRVPRAGIAIDP